MAFTVSINGNNYISEKRKTRFEKALVDSQRIKLGGNGQKPPISEPQAQVATESIPESPSASPVKMQPIRDYSRLFETLELGLKQSYGHQSETLRVHQQYLHNQAEYANIFSQLMQQQGTLFSNGNTAPEKSEITLTVLKSLAKSIEQFHQHQTDTLNVHNQFLNQQSAYSQAFVQLLHQQVNGSNGGNGQVKGHDVVSFAPAVEVRPQPLYEPVIHEQTHTVPVENVLKPVSIPDVPVYVPPVDPEPIQLNTQVITLESDKLSAMLLSIVSDKTGYPVEMLELDMDMEADLGIDSIKRVEILGALQDEAPELPEIDAEMLAELHTLAQIITYIEQSISVPESSMDVRVEELPDAGQVLANTFTSVPVAKPESTIMKASLLDIVSDKTGYPAEMLELDMDMEADLGIDSIKRVEILGALQDQYPSMPEIDADTLSDLRTLQQIIDYIEAQEPAEKKV